MSAEENKATARRFYEEIANKRNLDRLATITDTNVVNHDPALREDRHGLEAFKQTFAEYLAASSDVQYSVHDVIAEGDKVVRWTVEGTHDGPLLGIPPSGKRGAATGITLFRFADGKIAETWSNWDILGLLQQIGAIPQPEQARASS